MNIFDFFEEFKNIYQSNNQSQINEYINKNKQYFKHITTQYSKAIPNKENKENILSVIVTKDSGAISQLDIFY